MTGGMGTYKMKVRYLTMLWKRNFRRSPGEVNIAEKVKYH